MKYYLSIGMGFAPIRMIAFGGVELRETPNEIPIPALSGATTDDAAVRLPSSAKIFFNSSTSALSSPVTDTPNEMVPAGCIVRRLSRIVIRALAKAPKIWVASMSPSVSLEYDLIFDKAARKLGQAGQPSLLSFR